MDIVPSVWWPAAPPPRTAPTCRIQSSSPITSVAARLSSRGRRRWKRYRVQMSSEVPGQGRVAVNIERHLHGTSTYITIDCINYKVHSLAVVCPTKPDFSQHAVPTRRPRVRHARPQRRQGTRLVRRHLRDPALQGNERRLPPAQVRRRPAAHVPLDSGRRRHPHHRKQLRLSSPFPTCPLTPDQLTRPQSTRPLPTTPGSSSWCPTSATC